MQLRALAGAYAGQVRQFSTRVGMDALRSGTAEQPDARQRVAEQATQTQVGDRSVVTAGKRRRQK